MDVRLQISKPVPDRLDIGPVRPWFMTDVVIEAIRDNAAYLARAYQILTP